MGFSRLWERRNEPIPRTRTGMDLCRTLDRRKRSALRPCFIQARIWVAHDSEEGWLVSTLMSGTQIYWEEAASFTMGVPNPLCARDCTFVAWRPSILTESPQASA